LNNKNFSSSLEIQYIMFFKLISLSWLPVLQCGGRGGGGNNSHPQYLEMSRKGYLLVLFFKQGLLLNHRQGQN
jgi:hypothetical protein